MTATLYTATLALIMMSTYAEDFTEGLRKRRWRDRSK